MSVNIMQFKSRIRNLAKEEGIPAQVMLQNFMFERFFAPSLQVHSAREPNIEGRCIDFPVSRDLPPHDDGH